MHENYLQVNQRSSANLKNIFAYFTMLIPVSSTDSGQTHASRLGHAIDKGLNQGYNF